MTLTERKRRSIVDAAIDEFGEHGFNGANMARIAQRAEVSSRTLYKHFESKDVLFDAISGLIIARNQAMRPFPYDPARPGQLMCNLLPP